MLLTKKSTGSAPAGRLRRVDLAERQGLLTNLWVQGEWSKLALDRLLGSPDLTGAGSLRL